MITRLVPQDFQMVSGNDKVLKFTTTDEDGNIVDLTGGTIIWALANAAKSKKKLAEYTSPTNVTITDATGGLFEVAVQAADTLALKGGEYYHEARVQSSAGKLTTVAIGTVEILDNVIA